MSGAGCALISQAGSHDERFVRAVGFLDFEFMQKAENPRLALLSVATYAVSMTKFSERVEGTR